MMMTLLSCEAGTHQKTVNFIYVSSSKLTNPEHTLQTHSLWYGTLEQSKDLRYELEDNSAEFLVFYIIQIKDPRMQ